MTPDDLETDPRFPSGKWQGFWTQTIPLRAKPLQEMVLAFHRGTIEGEGRDPVGPFIIRGTYSIEDGQCRWMKRYIGRHDVFSRGFNEGKGIWGTWEILDTIILRGGFHIWPEGLPVPSASTLAAEADLPIGDLVEVN